MRHEQRVHHHEPGKDGVAYYIPKGWSAELNDDGRPGYFYFRDDSVNTLIYERMFDYGDIGDNGNNGLGGENKDRMLHHARVSNIIEGYREDYDVEGSIEVRVDSVDNCKRYRIDFDYRNMGTLKHRSDCIIALPDCGF